jgi:hypothetical protein
LPFADPRALRRRARDAVSSVCVGDALEPFIGDKLAPFVWDRVQSSGFRV